MLDTAVDGSLSHVSVTERWYVLTLMSVGYTINIADRFVMSTFLEPIRLELHLTDSGIAFLSGVSLALFYVTFGIPISWLADRANRRNILAVSLALWSTMTVLCGLSANYWQLLLARIGVGIGEAGGTPPSTSIVADCFPASRRPMALTVFALGAPIGAWIGASIAGALANLIGWREGFVVLGIPGLILGFIVYTTMREPQRGRLDARSSMEKSSFLESLRFLWHQRSAMHILVGQSIFALWGWGLMWWTPTFLVRTYNMNVGEAGAIIGPIHLMAGSAATILTAWVLSRPFMTDPRRLVWGLAGGVAFATIPSFILYWTHDLWLAKLMLWIFIPGIYFYIGPIFALLQNLAPAGMRSMFTAISLLTANVCNLIVAPQAVGFMSDLFAGAHGANAYSLRLALLVLAPTGFWGAYQFALAAKTIIPDQVRAIGYINEAEAERTLRA
jgi:predicted MFS family arabinose efflux permease